MPSVSKFLRRAAFAALVGLAATAAITPANARDFDGHGELLLFPPAL